MAAYKEHSRTAHRRDTLREWMEHHVAGSFSAVDCLASGLYEGMGSASATARNDLVALAQRGEIERLAGFSPPRFQVNASSTIQDGGTGED